jgi:hypothetical protein
MKRPGFFEGVGVALVASVAGGVLFSMLVTLFAGGFVLRVLIAGLGLLYILYLLRRSDERVGRITTVALWWVVAASIWFMDLSLSLYLGAHLGLIWLIRSLYFHTGLFSAFADLGLVALGLVAAVWAALESGNLFLSFWCFFLVQALFVLIPDRWKRQTARGNRIDPEDRFQRAHRVAEAALTRLSTVR